ncbi:MAG: MFS transporter [Acidimicrobiales bacterium]
MRRTVDRSVVDAADVDAMMQPRHDLLVEQVAGDGRFVAATGPVRSYERRIHVDGGVAIHTVTFELALPYFGWLFVLPFKRALRRPPGPAVPWWAPPAPLDARGARAVGTLAAVAVMLGYLNTLFTQTIAFAGEQFGADDGAQGVAGAVVRLGGLLALAVVATADRRGRRRVILAAATAGCALAVTGALAPSLPWLAASQTLARGFATALLLLVGIVSAEEVPARCRAYAVSALAMAAGLGAGLALCALPLADLGAGGWRLLYVLPAAGLPLVVSVRHRLPESRRFLAPHRDVHFGGHGRRLWLLAISGLLTNLFVAPQSQFGNRFLRAERGYSAGRIALLSLVAGAPGAIGIVAGGRIADLRGRRKVAAVALVGGTLCTVAFFFARGWLLWVLPTVGTMVSAASIPALGVYGPELFPTSLRGRANGVISICALAGSATGLVLAGALGDSFGELGPAMAILATGPIIVAAMVLTLYPETAGRELEELNPEDVRPPPVPPP